MSPDRAHERLVLVVDDDPDILQTLALCLSTEGYGVLMAANGQEALDLLRREKPAVILLDLMMPVMDGWQFISEIDQRGWRKAPILILSADRAVQGHANRLRADAFLAKPFDLEELLGKVSQLTGGPDHPHGKKAATG
jgi:two-component system response regulator MprA